MSKERTSYWVNLSDAGQIRFQELADLCELGRDRFHGASENGFLPRDGTEARSAEIATGRSDWPGGAWPSGATATLHQVGLMIGLGAAGHLGEMTGLLRSGEVVWSLPLLSRGVLENCGRLFRIYQRPFVATPPGGTVSPSSVKEMYAAAGLEILVAAFGARTLASETLKINPGSRDLQDRCDHADRELNRLRSAYGPLFDPARTDASSRKKLKLEGLEPYVMTELTDELIAWLWPDPARRPAPQYRVISGLAHSSLDAQISLFQIDDSSGVRQLTRSLPIEHIEYLVLIACLVFQRIFARLTGFYGWEDQPLHDFSERLALTFPDHFAYR